MDLGKRPDETKLTPFGRREALPTAVRLNARLGVTALKVAWLEASVLGDASKHPRSDFLAIVKGENKIGPTVAALTCGANRTVA